MDTLIRICICLPLYVNSKLFFILFCHRESCFNSIFFFTYKKLIDLKIAHMSRELAKFCCVPSWKGVVMVGMMVVAKFEFIHRSSWSHKNPISRFTACPVHAKNCKCSTARNAKTFGACKFCCFLLFLFCTFFELYAPCESGLCQCNLACASWYTIWLDTWRKSRPCFMLLHFGVVGFEYMVFV